MVATRQDFELRRGEGRSFRFTVPGAATLTQASWRCGRTRASEVLIDKATGGSGIVLEDLGADLLVTVTVAPADTEPLPLGRLFHELWLTSGAGQPVPSAEGALIIYDSLRA